VPGYTTTASYTKAPVGSLATVAGPDGEEYALVPLDTEDGMGMERKGPGNVLLLLLLLRICSSSSSHCFTDLLVRLGACQRILGRRSRN